MPQFADGKAIRHFSQKTMIGNIVEKPDAEAGERASGRQVGKPVKLQYDEVPSSEMGRPEAPSLQPAGADVPASPQDPFLKARGDGHTLPHGRDSDQQP